MIGCFSRSLWFWRLVVIHQMRSPSASQERRGQPGNTVEKRQAVGLATPFFGTGCQTCDILFSGRLLPCLEQGVAHLQRQDVYQNGRQGVGVYLLPKTKTVSCCFYHRLVALNGLPKRLQRDGLEKKAGDEIRTRDSLLGRQELYLRNRGRMFVFSCLL